MFKPLNASVRLACAVWLLLASSSMAHADVTNGSFETPVVPANSFTLFPVGGSPVIPGWTVIGPPGTDVGIVDKGFIQNSVTFAAGDGNQWLDLTGFNSNSTEGVAQSVTTIPGHTYQLSYLIGNTTGGGIFGTTSTVNVSVSGGPTFSDTNSTSSAATLNWQQFTHTFVATGNTTMLSFINGDPNTDNSNGLDGIVFTDLGVVGAVPEPASGALLVSGLLGLGILARRKK